MSATIQKWGNSLGVRIPKTVADKVNVTNGSKMDIIVKDGTIILKPVEKKPTLEELMAGITKDNQHEEIDWGKPEGREVW